MSFRARVLSAVVRRHVRSRMKTEADIIAMRRVLERVAFSPPRVRFTPEAHGGIEGEGARVPRRASYRLFYIHGGGFVACSPRTHRPLTGAFARRGFDVFAPRYRLAPEHPFPAALDDIVAAWQAFAAEGPACIAGDSAGGTLALALLLRARDEGLELPRAVFLMSPGTDLLAGGASIIENAAHDAMLNLPFLQKIIPLYVGDADPADPLLSPLHGDLAGLPPLMLHVGAREILRDDSVRLADKARAAGVTVTLQIFPQVPHVWQWADRMLPEARRSLNTATRFMIAALPVPAVTKRKRFRLRRSPIL